ncbi:MAG: uroporphyrinogen decarboxylase family protein, partial [Candidatus Latescibacterota bacterium]
FVPWGGIPVEYLVSGTQDDIKKEVRKAMEEYKSGGRYIFGSTHSIAVGTKYDNFMIMADEFERSRIY